MARPEFLYRGTPNRNAQQFIPKETVGSRVVVTATAHKEAATQFVVPNEELPIKMVCIEGIYYYLCADKEAFLRLDKGGAIHTVSVTGFEPVPQIGADIWINPNPVTSISYEEVSSGLEAMIDAGVQVYFVSPEVLQKFKTFSNERREILQGLISENMRLKKNVKNLP